MKLSSTVLTVGGLCTLLASASGMAFAQGYHGYGDYHHHPHHAVRRERRHLQVLHQVYNHEAKSGHYSAAEQAHLRANAIRAHIRAQRSHHM